MKKLETDLKEEKAKAKKYKETEVADKKATAELEVRTRVAGSDLLRLNLISIGTTPGREGNYSDPPTSS